MSDIPVTRLRELIRYDADSGKLFWLPRVPSDFEATEKRSPEWLCKWWNTRFANQEAFTAQAGSLALHGKLFGVPIYAHRVAWALLSGEWPNADIDHIDGNRTNNRAGNIRLVSHSENMRNKAKYSTNKSGHAGVIFHHKKKKWEAFIGGRPNRRHLGAFNNFDDAVKARKLAEIDHGYHRNHGRAT